MRVLLDVEASDAHRFEIRDDGCRLVRHSSRNVPFFEEGFVLDRAHVSLRTTVRKKRDVLVIGGGDDGGTDEAPLHAAGVSTGIRLGGRFRHAVGITQGCRPLGEPVRVTRPKFAASS